MKLVNVMAKTMMCAAALTVGCVDESEALEQRDGALFDDELDELDELADDEQSDEASMGFAPDPGGADAKVVGIEVLDVTIPASLHAQGLAVPGKLARPKWSKPVGKRPAMMVLHGSGGLLKMPESKADKPCSPDMESQFALWSDRLVKLGYTVLLPSSYSARGFCDKHKDTKRMPKTFDDKPEQILGRIYDLDAATRYLCDRPEVDCERMGVMGFSQGGTMTMLALHWQIEEAIAYFRKTKAKTVDIDIPDVKPGRPEYVMGIAYYPGCGFDGVVPLTTGKKPDIEDKFSPTAPLTILHGSKDPLLKECSTKYGPGARQTQSKEVAASLEIPDIYEITVYEGASHSFDNAGGKNPGDANKNADAAARTAALDVTLEKLATQL